MRWKRVSKIYSSECFLSATKGVDAVDKCNEDDCNKCVNTWGNDDGHCKIHNSDTPCYYCVVPNNVKELSNECGECPHFDGVDTCTKHNIEIDPDDVACDNCPIS